jgi:hypothetical protein
MSPMPRSLPEGLSELVDAHQTALDLLGVCDVSCADPFLKSIEASLFALDEVAPIVDAVRSEGSHEASVGVGRSVEFEPASDGGK